MKVIITKTFEEQYNKFFGKEYLRCSIEKVISIINKEIIIHEIYINRPFMKIKFKFCNRFIRLLVLKDEDIYAIIPVFITDKNDKKYGYNMIWNLVKDKVLKIMINITKDISNKNYEIF